MLTISEVTTAAPTIVINAPDLETALRIRQCSVLMRRGYYAPELAM